MAHNLNRAQQDLRGHPGHEPGRGMGATLLLPYFQMDYASRSRPRLTRKGMGRQLTFRGRRGGTSPRYGWDRCAANCIATHGDTWQGQTCVAGCKARASIPF